MAKKAPSIKCPNCGATITRGKGGAPSVRPNYGVIFVMVLVIILSVIYGFSLLINQAV